MLENSEWVQKLPKELVKKIMDLDEEGAKDALLYMCGFKLTEVAPNATMLDLVEQALEE